eukprot:9905915-Heterocapsa_arctica.AAC.1
MVALGSIAGSAPNTEDSGGDAFWAPEKKISHMEDNPLSNRKNPGARRKCMDLPAQVILNMAEQMDWAAWAKATYDMPVRRLKKMMLQASQLKTRVDEISVKKTRCSNNGR